jgi:regulator of nucleoside diphosphate kinase
MMIHRLRPPIILTVSDHQRLTAAALNALLQTPRLAAGLLEEVDRASVVPDHALSPDVARLGSWVEFVADGGPPRRARLVLEPETPEALPVLSPAGAALIGLRRGETIAWLDRLGSEARLTLLEVDRPGGDAT